MMDINEYYRQALETDGLNIIEFIQKYFPEISIKQTELFPNYPSQPYRQMNPDATNDEIFMKRVHPWLLSPIQLVSKTVPNVPITVHLQTSPFSGTA